MYRLFVNLMTQLDLRMNRESEFCVKKRKGRKEQSTNATSPKNKLMIRERRTGP